MRVNTIKSFYEDGYNDGYNHLAQGRWNFLHPKGSYTYPNGRILHGYIPGGPRAFVNEGRVGYRSPEYNAARKLESDLNSAWLRGWIDGINKYTLENNLPYPQLENTY